MKKRSRLRLRLKLKRLDGFLIVTVSCLLIFVMMLFQFYTYNVKTSQTELIGLVLERMSENQKTHFESYVEEKVQLLQGLAKYPQVYNMDDEQIEAFLKNKAKSFGFEYMFLMKASGTGFYFDEGKVYREQGSEPFFKDIMSHDVYITEPFYTDKGPAITTVCVSIYDGNKDKVGVLCGALNLEDLQKIVKNSEMVLEGSCFILNEAGNYIASNTQQFLHSQQSIFNQEDSKLEAIVQAFEEEKDLVGNITIKGVEYKAYMTYLKDFNWVIVQCIPTAEIVKRFEHFDVLQRVMVFLAIGLMVCIVRIIFSWKRSDKKIYTDSLTQCNSRAACISLIESLEDQRNMRVSIVYMDLNNFKHVNDTYGHDKGDNLLVIFGAVLKEVFEKRGFVGRLGGDEFITILADANDDEIERMCKEVEQLLWEQSKNLDFPYVISSSYGYASRNVGQPETIEEVMQQADEKMYLNKAKHHTK